MGKLIDNKATGGRRFGIADSVTLELRKKWLSRRDLLEDFLASIDMPKEQGTRALMLFPQSTLEPEALVRNLTGQLADEGSCAFITASSSQDSKIRVLAFPAKNFSPTAVHLAPFIEIHSRLIAWWLTTAWRASELSRSVWSLGDEYLVIASAACARALIETAAALWCDARAPFKQLADDQERGMQFRICVERLA